MKGSGNVLPQTGQFTYLTKVILSQPGDPNPNGFLLVDYTTDYDGNTGNFRAMEGMGLQMENALSQGLEIQGLDLGRSTKLLKRTLATRRVRALLIVSLLVLLIKNVDALWSILI